MNFPTFSSVSIIRIVLFVLALVTWSQTSQAALVAYWNFDESSGTTVFDTAGNAVTNNGLFGAGAQAPARVTGRLGGALGFTWQVANTPGAGRLVNVPYHTNLTLNGPFTISYWYRPDAPFPAGTFPGIMRMGTSQSALTGTNVGWGFFRQNNMVYKRGNTQPAVFTAMNVGQWYHLALRFDGTLTGNNNIAFVNGVQLPFSVANGWSNVTTTLPFQMGQMDAFDQATLDDLALWGSEAVAPARIRSLYTVPTSLFLDYNLADLRAIWGIFDAGAGASGVVKGATWSYNAALPGSPALGDAYVSGSGMHIALGAGVGVSTPVMLLSGPFSPGGIGLIGTLAPTNAFTITNANLVFDLNAATTPGGTVNDLIDVTGDLTIVNSIVSIDPLAPLPGGTYRLFNYSAAKSGSLSLSNASRYTMALDESTTNQINLTVSGTNGYVMWTSTNSGVWDLGTLNWSNLLTAAPDRFFQGDAVVFDDSGPFQTNITINTPVFPRSITVNSANRPYAFTGTEQIGGMAEGITKNGTNVLVLGTPNTFSGDVQVNAGTLRLGNSAALGLTNGLTTIASGAILDLGGVSPGREPVTVQGSGINSTGAVVNTGAALSNNGLLGRVTLAGDTTFGGINRWDVFGGTLVGNGFKLTKSGPPEIALSNLGDTGLGEIDVRQGILTILGSTGMGDPTKTTTVNTNAILAFWQIAPNVLNKPVVMNSAIMRNATSGGTDIATNLGATTINGDGRFEATANIALLGDVSGGNVIKLNAGTLYLGGTNTYTGITTISAGRLALLATGSINNSPRINIQSGTVFDVTRLSGGYSVASGQTLTGSGSVHGSLNLPSGGVIFPGIENIAANLTITNGLALTGGTLTYDLAAATTEGAGVNDLINVGGDLDLVGTSSIVINPLGVLMVGNVYTLINYTGVLSGTEANLTVINNTHYTFSLSVATPGKVLLTVTGGAAAELLWFGGTAGAETLWNIQTTPNWLDSLSAPATFFGGDIVKFDDFALTNVVDLVGNLTPASITIENGDPAFAYTFTGSGKLSGNSTLTKTFGATATIANTAVNDYIGATTIAAGGGTLQVGTGGTFGNLGSGPITNDSTLIFNRSDTITLANTIVGTGSIVKSNANLMVLPTANLNYSGSFTAAGGTIRPGVSNALGNTTGGTVIAAGATLDINAVNLGDEVVTVAGDGVGSNGAIINASATGQNNALRFVTMTGNTRVGGTGRWDIRAAPTASLSTGGNGYSLTKVGANQVSLVDAVVDPALGDINVNGGIFSAELSSGAGDPTRTLTLASGATLQFFNRSVVWDKIHVLNGGSTVINNTGNNVMNGAVTLGGTVTFNVGATSLTVNSNIIGSGALTKTGTGALILNADNTYPGATTINASSGSLQLGSGTNGGGVAGPLIMNNNTLTVWRLDAITVSNTFTGTGTLNVRTPGGLVIKTNTLNFALINVGLTTPGRLVLQPGVTATIGSYSIGESPGGAYGEVYQLGGTNTVSGQFRLGHWPNETSTYIMGNGALTLTGIPSIVVNVNTNNEQVGVIYLGVDGVGIFTQTGGVVRTHGMVFDARGNSAGTDTFTLEGGQCILGPSGLKSGSFDANTSYAINLGGGILASSASWTSVLAMTFTGTNGNTTVDTAANTNILTGALSGAGALTKVGSGTLVLSGSAPIQGNTVVSNGTLVVRGSLGSGGGSVTVQGGTLAGDGSINVPVVIGPGATLSPGLSIGRLAVNSTLTLAGTNVMEISRTGATLTNDLLAVSSSLTYGGTLRVTASGDALLQGNTFKLFDASSYSGSFANLSLPSLTTGLVWNVSQLPIDGTIRVQGPSLSLVRMGDTIELSWPDGFPGFNVQSQTNAPGVGITSNWVTLPNMNTNRLSFPVLTNAEIGSVFFRLIQP